ncbi:MAG TPA: class II aldolase/adducin family protein [Stellaceae bacterium]|nr:class II aldolase/adducin family protein [Stellaceae bacterium]
MAGIDALIEDIVIANRILAAEGITDAYGHVAVRHPERPDRYLLARARSPQMIEAADIVEYTLDGTPIDLRAGSSYLERFIHGALFELRLDVGAVVHSHSLSSIPFGVGGETIRPMLHNTAIIGATVPIWDSRDRFGDTDMLVRNMEMGRDLARTMGRGTTALMRGHGSVVAERSLRRAVFCAIALQTSANLQREVRHYERARFLSPGEVEQCVRVFDEAEQRPLQGIDRAWEYYCHRAGMPYRPG